MTSKVDDAINKSLSPQPSSRIFESALWKAFAKNPNHTETASLYHELDYEHWLYCLKQGGWFECVGGIWYQRGKSCPNLYPTFKEKIAPLVEAWVDTLMVKLRSVDGDEKKTKDVKDDIFTMVKFLANLSSANMQNSVLKLLPQFYTREDVLGTMIDQNPDIFCFSDTLYELETGFTRPIFSCDYVMTTTGYPYPSNVPQERIDEVDRILRSMHETDEDHHYVKSLLAYSLSGSRYEEIFVCCVGVGSNGKSILMDMVKKSFGNYFATMPISYYTQKRSSSSTASPEVANKKGKRFVCTGETEVDEKFHMGKIKGDSDMIEARALFGNPFTFKPQHTLWIHSNNDPKLSTVDNGTVRRYRGVEFSRLFVDNPDPQKPAEVKRDPDLKTKVERGDYRDALIVLLLDHYKKYIRGRKPIPPTKKASEYTREVVSASDLVATFVEEHLELTGDEKNDRMSVNTCFAHYQKVMGDKAMDIRNFGKKIKTHNIPRNQRFLLGVKVRETGETPIVANF